MLMWGPFVRLKLGESMRRILLRFVKNLMDFAGVLLAPRQQTIPCSDVFLFDEDIEQRI